MLTSLRDRSSYEGCHEGNSPVDSAGCGTGPTEDVYYEAELESPSL